MCVWVCVCHARARVCVRARALQCASGWCVWGAAGAKRGHRARPGRWWAGSAAPRRRAGVLLAESWRSYREGLLWQRGAELGARRASASRRLLALHSSFPVFPRPRRDCAATASLRTVAGGGCPVRSKPAGRCRTPTPGSGERARPCPGSDNCGGGGGGSALLVAGLSDRSQRRARSERRVAGGAVWACAPDLWLAGGTQRPGATRPSAWSAPRGCAEAAAATVAMQPAQRRPGPGTAARSLEDAGRAAPRPLTEVRARPRAHGPPARPQFPADSFLPRVSEGWCSNREGEAEELPPFLFLLSRGEPPDEMLTESFSSPAMFRATATRELCSGLTSFQGCIYVLRGREGRLSETLRSS